MATDPSNNPGAPPTPFDMTEYEVAEFIEGDRLAAVADEAAVAALAGHDQMPHEQTPAGLATPDDIFDNICNVV